MLLVVFNTFFELSPEVVSEFESKLKSLLEAEDDKLVRFVDVTSGVAEDSDKIRGTIIKNGCALYHMFSSSTLNSGMKITDVVIVTDSFQKNKICYFDLVGIGVKPYKIRFFLVDKYKSPDIVVEPTTQEETSTAIVPVEAVEGEPVV